MHDNAANGNNWTAGAAEDMRVKLGAAIDAAGAELGGGRGLWARSNGFDPADLSRFLSGKKDWTLSKLLHLVTRLDAEIVLYLEVCTFSYSPSRERRRAADLRKKTL